MLDDSLTEMEFPKLLDKIIQYSYNSVLMEGGDSKKLGLKIPRSVIVSPAALGARRISRLMSEQVGIYNADMMFLALDNT